jgi:hypothetical protein
MTPALNHFIITCPIGVMIPAKDVPWSIKWQRFSVIYQPALEPYMPEFPPRRRCWFEVKRFWPNDVYWVKSHDEPLPESYTLLPSEQIIKV